MSTADFFLVRCHLISRMIRRAITRLSEQVTKMIPSVRVRQCMCVYTNMCVTAKKMFVGPLTVTSQTLSFSFSLKCPFLYTFWITHLWPVISLDLHATFLIDSFTKYSSSFPPLSPVAFPQFPSAKSSLWDAHWSNTHIDTLVWQMLVFSFSPLFSLHFSTISLPGSAQSAISPLCSSWL